MVFVGTYEHTLDTKGRLVLPSKFRSHFADAAYLSPGAGCISLWTPVRFEEHVHRLEEEARKGDTSQDVLRGLASKSEEVRPDAQGRIMMPTRLQTFANLDREIIICGNIHHIEIWNASSWTAMADELDESVEIAFRQGSGI
ncbi:MAG: Transcriptional regulator MraZ [Acidimicrobiales bacterium AG-410-I20]|nr:MAG: Transcriptional regulator MraZ [Acidimicrobiales bacterium AG-410-I20]